MKRVAYLNCQAGIAGDMALAALIHAGADLKIVRAAVNAVAGMETGLDIEPASGSTLTGFRLQLDLPHEHAHRTMADIRSMIDNARTQNALPPRAADRAVAIFQALAAAEGRVHGMEPDKVHFHEVGAMDSIADIVGVAAALESLNIDVVAA